MIHKILKEYLIQTRTFIINQLTALKKPWKTISIYDHHTKIALYAQSFTMENAW